MITDFTSEASAIASPNLALVKYWGKRDPSLMLPETGSIGITLDGLEVHSTIRTAPHSGHDRCRIGGCTDDDGRPDQAISRFLEVLREKGRTAARFEIRSAANFEPRSGLASSSAAFAALALAGTELLGLSRDERDVSRLARLGSGSATRAAHGGFVEWRKGERPDGNDSFGVPLANHLHWPELRVLVCVTSASPKKVSSRAAMAACSTSPLHHAWRTLVEEDLEVVRDAIAARDLRLLGSTAERNCLAMHAVAHTSSPSVMFWNETTLEVMDLVRRSRAEGLRAWFTIDAGPHVKVLCDESEREVLHSRLESIPSVRRVVASGPGRGARRTEAHLGEIP